jgi:signal transduction histidine kinase
VDGSYPGFWFFNLVFVTVVVRAVISSMGDGIFNPLVYSLLGGFLVLSLVNLFMRKRLWVSNVYYLAQTLVVFILLFSEPSHDYYAMLYIGLGLSVSRSMPEGYGIFWLCVFCIMPSVALLLVFDFSEGLSYIPSYVGGVLLVGLYGRATEKATNAVARSEALLKELEAANRRLREYAEGAKETATVEERARLARELHDAVTQTIFSMNLTAEAAKIAHKSRPSRVPEMLERLQELARDALGEMRSMVEELRQQGAAEKGLVAALEKHIALRGRRDGLRASLAVEGGERGSPEMKDALFRTAQEALNNVLRHSGTKEASILVRFEAEESSLSVKDEGIGFDAAGARGGKSFGLLTMRERVEALGGRLIIESAPGKGTLIRASVPLERIDNG